MWHERNHILFPGYVLIKGNIDSDKYYSFKNVPSLWDLIKDDENVLSISQFEIKIIDQLMCNSELIKESKVVEISGQVMVMEGHIVKVDKRKGRVKVNISFLGNSI